MGQAAPLVINDGQATPVATTFAPESVTPAAASFADRSSGISLTYRRLKFSTKFASGNSVVNRTLYEVAIPVGVSVGGVTELAYTLRGRVELIIPDGATAAQRNDLFAFVQNGLANTALIRPLLRDLDPMY